MREKIRQTIKNILSYGEGFNVQNFKKVLAKHFSDDDIAAVLCLHQMNIFGGLVLEKHLKLG